MKLLRDDDGAWANASPVKKAAGFVLGVVLFAVPLMLVVALVLVLASRL